MSQILKERRKAAADELLKIADAVEAGEVSDEQRERANELQAELRKLDADIDLVANASQIRHADTGDSAVDQTELRRIAQGAPDGKVEVQERSPYGKDATDSWVRDAVLVSDKRASVNEKRAAAERLGRHYAASSDDTSVEQVRAMSTGGNAGDLVAPAYIQNEFIEALSEVPSTAGLVRHIPIDTDPYAHTTSVRVPKQTARVGIAEHTENQALAGDDVETTSVRVDVSRGGGIAAIPNFMLQRALPGLDGIVMADLAAAAAEDLNEHVLTANKTYSKGFLAQSGLGSSPFTSGTPTLQQLYAAVLGAFEDVLSGVKRGGAEAVVMHPSVWFWALGQLNADTRPYIGPTTPDNAIGSHGLPNGVSPAGHILGVPVVLDAAVPKDLGSGSNESAVIVAKFSESWLLRGTPRFAVSEHSGFDNDQTKMRVTIDRGFTCERRKEATSIVGGTGLAI